MVKLYVCLLPLGRIERQNYFHLFLNSEIYLTFLKLFIFLRNNHIDNISKSTEKLLKLGFLEISNLSKDKRKQLLWPKGHLENLSSPSLRIMQTRQKGM